MNSLISIRGIKLRKYKKLCTYFTVQKWHEQKESYVYSSVSTPWCVAVDFTLSMFHHVCHSNRRPLRTTEPSHLLHFQAEMVL